MGTAMVEEVEGWRRQGRGNEERKGTEEDSRKKRREG